MNLIETILHNLDEAHRAATMERMSLGFSTDRLEVKSVHSGDYPCTNIKQGQELHPDEFVKGITRLYRETWILPQIKTARDLIEANAELFRLLERLGQNIRQQDLKRIAELMRAGLKDPA